MNRRPLRALALLMPLAAVVAACAAEPVDTATDATCAALLRDPDSLDANDWLKAASPLPKHPGTMTPDDALGLVSRLVFAGAPRIVAAQVKKVRAPVPGEFSRGAVVTLPDDPAQRLAIFRLYATQVRAQGQTPRADSGQKYLYVPWSGTTPVEGSPSARSL